MAKQTETQTTFPLCADRCGQTVSTAKATFLQGHDQRLVSRLAREVTVDHLSDDMKAVLNLTDWDEQSDIQERINALVAATQTRFSPALASKVERAAHRAWDLSVKRGNTEARKAQRAAKPRPQGKAAKKATTVDEIQDQLVGLDASTETGFAGGPAKSTVGQIARGKGITMGAPVKAKIGRWTYDAFVHGMNQSGKVTAVSYQDKKDNEKIAHEGKFTLVDA